MFSFNLGSYSLKVKAPFIYKADRKASVYSCRFFCSACFQLRSTTGTLLLILRPRRVTGGVDHTRLYTMTHIVVQDVRTRHQWSSLPKTGTLWCSYLSRVRLKVSFRTNSQVNTPNTFHHSAPGWGASATTNGRGRQTVKFDSHAEGIFTLTPTMRFELALKRYLAAVVKQH